MSRIAVLTAAAQMIRTKLDDVLAHAQIGNTERDTVCGMLLMSISESHEAALTLFDSRMQSHGPVHVRSMLEHFTALKLLAESQDYLSQMKFESTDQKRMLLNEFSKLEEIEPDDEMRAQLQSEYDALAPRLEELKGKGLVTQSFPKKLADAKLPGYYAAYRTYCSFAHVNFETLKARHFSSSGLLRGRMLPEAMIVPLIKNGISLHGLAIKLLPNFAKIDDAYLAAALEGVDDMWERAEKIA